jgi:hypothetical protein
VVLRLAFLSKSALASLLVTSYVTVLGLMGLAGGFIADRVSSHVVKSATKVASPLRPDSRVEKWLKTQTVSYTTADARMLDDVIPNVVGSGREIPPVAELAAAMDRSEQSASGEAVIAEPIVARITAPVHQRRNTGSGDACKAGSCEASIKSRVTKTRLAMKVQVASGQRQAATLKAKAKRNLETSVADAGLGPVDGKMGLGLKPSLGAVKVVPKVTTKVAAKVTAKVPTQSPYRVWRNLHLADTPAEIIRRSLSGTS